MRWNSGGVSTPSHLRRSENASPSSPINESNTGILSARGRIRRREPVPVEQASLRALAKRRKRHPPHPRSYASRYLIPDPVLKTTTHSPRRILPSERSDLRAAKHA